MLPAGIAGTPVELAELVQGIAISGGRVNQEFILLSKADYSHYLLVLVQWLTQFFPPTLLGLSGKRHGVN